MKINLKKNTWTLTKTYHSTLNKSMTIPWHELSYLLLNNNENTTSSENDSFKIISMKFKVCHVSKKYIQTGSIFEILLLINDTNDVGHIYTCDYRGYRDFPDIKYMLIKTSSFFTIFHFVIVSILVEWLIYDFLGTCTVKVRN